VCKVCEVVEILKDAGVTAEQMSLTRIVFQPLCDTSGFAQLIKGYHYSELRHNAIGVYCRECDKGIAFFAECAVDWPMEYERRRHELQTNHRTLYIVSEDN
jgi:hypothetical protein